VPDGRAAAGAGEAAEVEVGFVAGAGAVDGAEPGAGAGLHDTTQGLSDAQVERREEAHRRRRSAGELIADDGNIG
jgi:hypothetical protein